MHRWHRYALLLAVLCGLASAQIVIPEGTGPKTSKKVTITVNGKTIELDSLKDLDLERLISEELGKKGGLGELTEVQKKMRELERRLLEEAPLEGPRAEEHAKGLAELLKQLKGMEGMGDDLLRGLAGELDAARKGPKGKLIDGEVIINGKRVPLSGLDGLILGGRPVREHDHDHDSDHARDHQVSRHRVVVKDGKVIVDEREGPMISADEVGRILEGLGAGVDIDEIHRRLLEKGKAAGESKTSTRRIIIKDGKVIEDTGKGTGEEATGGVTLRPLHPHLDADAKARAETEARLKELRERLKGLRKELESLEGGR